MNNLVEIRPCRISFFDFGSGFRVFCNLAEHIASPKLGEVASRFSEMTEGFFREQLARIYPLCELFAILFWSNCLQSALLKSKTQARPEFLFFVFRDGL